MKLKGAWILGYENPMEADANLYGFLASTLSCPAQVYLCTRFAVACYNEEYPYLTSIAVFYKH